MITGLRYLHCLLAFLDPLLGCGPLIVEPYYQLARGFSTDCPVEKAFWVPPDRRFIEDIKRKDFVASVVLTEAQVSSIRFMRDFAAACRAMLPLVEFTTRALG